jgi:hypothetical protein
MAVTPARPGGQVTLAGMQHRSRAGTAVGLLGPAFVAGIGYLDPGNFVTNFAAEAARLPAAVGRRGSRRDGDTGAVRDVQGRPGDRKSLPDLCRDRFGRQANVVLRVQAEAVAMATDLAEFTAGQPGPAASRLSPATSARRSSGHRSCCPSVSVALVPPLAIAADRQLLSAAVNRRVTSVLLAAVTVLITGPG